MSSEIRRPLHPQLRVRRPRAHSSEPKRNRTDDRGANRRWKEGNDGGIHGTLPSSAWGESCLVLGVLRTRVRTLKREEKGRERERKREAKKASVRRWILFLPFTPGLHAFCPFFQRPVRGTYNNGHREALGRRRGALGD